jgi:hypothetical protein
MANVADEKAKEARNAALQKKMCSGTASPQLRV